jgi:hypothetical protein
LAGSEVKPCGWEQKAREVAGGNAQRLHPQLGQQFACHPVASQPILATCRGKPQYHFPN